MPQPIHASVHTTTSPSPSDPELTMDEAIATVVTVTGSTPEIAAQYVQLADGDPNQAVQLFFENGGADLGGASAQPQPHPHPSTTSHETSHATGSAQDPVNLDDEGNISDDNDPEVTGYGKTTQSNAPPRPAGDFEDDEAMARRLQEEMYGDTGMEDVVRAPIARQAETLLGPTAEVLHPSGPEYDAALEGHMRAFQRRRNQGWFGFDSVEPVLTLPQSVLAYSTNTNPPRASGIETSEKPMPPVAISPNQRGGPLNRPRDRQDSLDFSSHHGI